MPLIFAAVDASAASRYNLVSPNRKIEIVVDAGPRIRYSVLFGGKPLLQDSTLSIKINRTTLGLQPVGRSAKQRSVDQQIQPAAHWWRVRRQILHIIE